MPFSKSLLYVYTKKRRTFGRQPMFQAAPAQLLDSIAPSRGDQLQYGLRNPVHQGVQATLKQSEHEANTKEVVVHEQSVDHTEGGWPRDVLPFNEEHTSRHRRRVMHEDNYVHAVGTIYPQMEHCIAQNNAIDMYKAYFAGMPREAPFEGYNVRVANVFRDSQHRPVTCVQWTNEDNPKLIACYDAPTKPLYLDLKENITCSIWDLHKTDVPLRVIRPTHICRTVACSPVEHEVFVAGMDNGTVSIFDIRESTFSVATSSVYNSHREAINSLLFTHTRTNDEFFTGSSDGQCLWWDLRNMSQPKDHLPMSLDLPSGVQPHLGNATGVSCLEYDNGLPSKFLCGTENGLVINCNRMGRDHSEVLTSYWDAHVGPVRKIQRSRCTTRMFMSCGDYSMRVWSDEVRSPPIIVTKPYRYEVIDAAWSPQQYSSCMVVCAGGFYYFWDFLRKYKEPVVTMRVSEHALTKITPKEDGECAVIGDTDGALFLLQLSENMAIAKPNGKQLIFQTYERETKREHILEARKREIRLKMREMEEAALLAAEMEGEEVLEEEDEFEKINEEYFQVVQKEMQQMGGMYNEVANP